MIRTGQRTNRALLDFFSKKKIAMEGVKFLSLSQRLPQTFSAVDAVLRDVAVSQLVDSHLPQSDPSLVSAVAASHEGDKQQVPPPPPPPPEGTIPFSASVSYSSLEDDADLIYAFIDTLLGRTHAQGASELPPMVPQTGPLFARKKSLELKQAAQLVELEQWRRQLMATVPVVGIDRGHHLPPARDAAVNYGDGNDDLLLEDIEGMSVKQRT